MMICFQWLQFLALQAKNCVRKKWNDKRGRNLRLTLCLFSRNYYDWFVGVVALTIFVLPTGSRIVLWNAPPVIRGWACENCRLSDRPVRGRSCDEFAGHLNRLENIERKVGSTSVTGLLLTSNLGKMKLVTYRRNQFLGFLFVHVVAWLWVTHQLVVWLSSPTADYAVDHRTHEWIYIYIYIT